MTMHTVEDAASMPPLACEVVPVADNAKTTQAKGSTMFLEATDLPTVCRHNKWTLQTKAKRFYLFRCMVCDSIWKTKFRTTQKCADFFLGHCPLGENCPHPHIYSKHRKSIDIQASLDAFRQVLSGGTHDDDDDIMRAYASDDSMTADQIGNIVSAALLDNVDMAGTCEHSSNQCSEHSDVDGDNDADVPEATMGRQSLSGDDHFTHPMPPCSEDDAKSGELLAPVGTSAAVSPDPYSLDGLTCSYYPLDAVGAAAGVNTVNTQAVTTTLATSPVVAGTDQAPQPLQLRSAVPPAMYTLDDDAPATISTFSTAPATLPSIMAPPPPSQYVIASHTVPMPQQMLSASIPMTYSCPQQPQAPAAGYTLGAQPPAFACPLPQYVAAVKRQAPAAPVATTQLQLMAPQTASMTQAVYPQVSAMPQMSGEAPVWYVSQPVRSGELLRQ